MTGGDKESGGRPLIELHALDLSALSDRGVASAYHMADSAFRVNLIIALVRKGLLTGDEVTEIFESALLTIEEVQSRVPLEDQPIFDAARHILEDSSRRK
jgi:hypothetical protein